MTDHPIGGRGTCAGQPKGADEDEERQETATHAVKDA
jgi:hypothetical protein